MPDSPYWKVNAPMRLTRWFVALILLLLASPSLAEPRIVTSFSLLQSLTAAIAGTAPETLVKGGGSPHTYAMRPSDARALEQADLVIWIGPDYEGFLERPVAALAGKARSLVLARAPGVSTLRTRSGGIWDSHDHGHGHSHGHKQANVDGHMFLDPVNAKAFARAIAATLAEMDPANQARYRANAGALEARLGELDGELAAKLRPLAGRPFIVFHDSLQYLERRYGLTPAGSITVSPERRPSAQRLQRLRERIGRANAICVFAEPQFDAALVRTVVEGTRARTGTLDYVGAEMAPGADLYFNVMRGLAKDLSACLASG
jgi:zinc transport system substrate-binding protein